MPGPYRTVQRTDDGTRTAIVGPEIDGAWTVRIGQPPTTIMVRRLADGRPATALIADAARDETVLFDPPLALVPRPGVPAPAAETTAIALYPGVLPDGPEPGERPKRTGTAERRFLAVEPAAWALEGRSLNAQRLTHELVLSLRPATIRQRYESTAVRGRGIVEETLVERVSVLGIRIGGREEHATVVEFVQPDQ